MSDKLYIPCYISPASLIDQGFVSSRAPSFGGFGPGSGTAPSANGKGRVRGNAPCIITTSTLNLPLRVAPLALAPAIAVKLRKYKTSTLFSLRPPLFGLFHHHDSCLLQVLEHPPGLQLYLEVHLPIFNSLSTTATTAQIWATADSHQLHHHLLIYPQGLLRKVWASWWPTSIAK